MPATRRDPWFDNAKMVLVTLVVIGHVIAFVPPSAASSHLYDAIYYVHMPAFVLLTGHLSRSFAWTSTHLWTLVATVAVPYVVFEGLMSLFRMDVGGEGEFDRVWVDPHWPMWFLAALFCWRLATPVLVRHWLWVPASVGISLLGPLQAFDVLDLDRVLGMLPFFVLGLHLPRRAFEVPRLPGVRLLGVGVLAWLWLLAGLTDSWIRTEWLYWRASYAEMDASLDQALVARFALLAISLAGILAVLTLVPRRGGWWTPIGAASLTVYLVHGFVVRGLEYADLWDVLPGGGVAEMAQVVVLGALIAVVLGAPPVASRLEWLVDPVRTAQGWWRRRTEPARQEADRPGSPAGSGACGSGGPHSGGTADDGTDSSRDASARVGA